MEILNLSIIQFNLDDVNYEKDEMKESTTTLKLQMNGIKEDGEK